MKDDERIFRRASDNDDAMNNMITNHWFYVLSKHQIFFLCLLREGKKHKFFFFCARLILFAIRIFLSLNKSLFIPFRSFLFGCITYWLWSGFIFHASKININQLYTRHRTKESNVVLTRIYLQLTKFQPIKTCLILNKM